MAKHQQSQRSLLIGHILEIRTKKGLIYAQCTHRVPFFGPLIRVIPGFHKKPLSDFTNVISEQELFVTFVFWNRDVDRTLMHIVGRAPVPERCSKFPLFKDGSRDPKTGKIAVWWLWDGEKEWRVGKLKASEKELPMRLIMNCISLIDRIESGWHPRDEVN